MKAKPRGGGGTDMRNCIKYIAKHAPDTEVVVILTDGYTPFPTQSEVPARMKILWLICPGGINQSQVPKDAHGDFIFMKRA
jgi:predicted metal-dependent peptidase